jgi:hypothetical protein
LRFVVGDLEPTCAERIRIDPVAPRRRVQRFAPGFDPQVQRRLRPRLAVATDRITSY